MSGAAGNLHQQSWLHGGVEVLQGLGAETGFVPEVDRVIELLGVDQAWREWWKRVSPRRPMLELQILLLRPPTNPISAAAMAYAGAEEVVRRRRDRCVVVMHADSGELAQLERDERRFQALPVVLDGISRAGAFLRAAEPPPTPPSSVQPAPLSGGVLRRRRLRQLLDNQRARLGPSIEMALDSVEGASGSPLA